MASPDGAQKAAHGRRLLLIYSALMLAMLLGGLDQTIISTALPAIAGGLGGLSHLSWVVTAYMLTSTATTQVWGKLGDQYGRKYLFAAAIVIFLVATAACGQSRDMTELICFRAVQGTGGGGMMVLAQAIIGDVVPAAERGKYQGAFGAAYGVASVAGPPLGGFVVDNMSWRWVFYINMPVGIVALIVVLAVLPAAELRKHKIDYLGAGLLAAFTTCVVLATSWGGTTYPWGSVEVIGLSAAAVVFLAGWWAAERMAAEPVLPLRLFRNRVFSASAGIGLATGFAMFGTVSFLPLFLQVAHGVSAALSGVYVLPLVFGMLITSVASGQLISRTGRYRQYPIVGTAVMAVTLFLLSRMDEHTSTLVLGTDFFVLGSGLGLVVQVLVIAVQNAVDYADLGAATSGATFFRTIGDSFGISVAGAIFASGLSFELTAALRGVKVPSGFSVSSVQASPKALAELPPRVHAAVVHVYSVVLHQVFVASVPIAGLAFILAWLLPQVPMRDAAPEPEPGGAGTRRVPDGDIERALAGCSAADIRRDGYARLGRAAGLDLPGGACWVLARLARGGPGDIAGTAAIAGKPCVRGLIDAGLVARAGGGLMLTPDGEQAAGRLIAERGRWLERLRAGWTPERNAQLAALLDKLCRAMLGDAADRHLADRA